MARRPRQPFRNKEPWVRQVYQWFWSKGYTPEAAYQKFHDLRRNPTTGLAEAAGFPPNLPLHPTPREQHSLDTVKAAWIVWNREHAGTLPSLWNFLTDPVPHQPQVLAAIAAWQSFTGEPWPVVTAEAKALDQLFTAAPDLPPLMAAALAQQLIRWETLPDDQRHCRLVALRDFLGFAPWRGHDHARAYQAWSEHQGGAILISPDGLAHYSTVLPASAASYLVVGTTTHQDVSVREELVEPDQEAPPEPELVNLSHPTS